MVVTSLHTEYKGIFSDTLPNPPIIVTLLEYGLELMLKQEVRAEDHTHCIGLEG